MVMFQQDKPIQCVPTLGSLIINLNLTVLRYHPAACPVTVIWPSTVANQKGFPWFPNWCQLPNLTNVVTVNGSNVTVN